MGTGDLFDEIPRRMKNYSLIFSWITTFVLYARTLDDKRGPEVLDYGQWFRSFLEIVFGSDRTVLLTDGPSHMG